MVAVSWAAIFIRLAHAPALSISAYRLIFGALPVAGFALLRRRSELATGLWETARRPGR